MRAAACSMISRNSESVTSLRAATPLSLTALRTAARLESGTSSPSSRALRVMLSKPLFLPNTIWRVAPTKSAETAQSLPACGIGWPRRHSRGQTGSPQQRASRAPFHLSTLSLTMRETSRMRVKSSTTGTSYKHCNASDLTQIRVTGSLAHSVDGPLDPGRTCPNRRNSASGCKTEVVMTVEMQRNLGPQPVPHLTDQELPRFRAASSNGVHHHGFVRARIQRRAIDAL